MNHRTVCVEVLLRDQINDRNEEYILLQKIELLTVERVSSRELLRVVDMTGGAMISHRLRSEIVEIQIIVQDGHSQETFMQLIQKLMAYCIHQD